MSLTYNLLPVLLSFYLGSWSDTYGRIPFIAINMMGKVSYLYRKQCNGNPNDWSQILFVSFDGFSICSFWVRFVCDFPGPSRDVTNQTLPGMETFNYSQPGSVWLVTFRLGTWKSQTFLTVRGLYFCIFLTYTGTWLSSNKNIIKTAMKESGGEVWHAHTQ